MSFQPIQLRTDNTKSINAGKDGKGPTIGNGSVNCKSVYPLWQSMGWAQETKTELSSVVATVVLGVHSTVSWSASCRAGLLKLFPVMIHFHLKIFI